MPMVAYALLDWVEMTPNAKLKLLAGLGFPAFIEVEYWSNMRMVVYRKEYQIHLVGTALTESLEMAWFRFNPHGRVKVGGFWTLQGI
tara:strand:+ start:272 stop:532 length:261 start_codon:yes stop_codon:yes gene_type:complete